MSDGEEPVQHTFLNTCASHPERRNKANLPLLREMVMASTYLLLLLFFCWWWWGFFFFFDWEY